MPMQSNEEKRSDLVIKLDWSSMLDDFWKGIRRFWMFLVLIIILSASLVYVYSAYVYSPEYTYERIYSLSRMNKTADDLGVAMAQRLAVSFDSTMKYSGIKEEMLERIKPQADELPAEISMKHISDTSFITITVCSDNYYNTEKIMKLFCTVYPTYANSIVGNMQLTLISDSFDENTVGFNSPRTLLEGAILGVVICVLWLCYYAVSRKTIRKEEAMHSITSIPCIYRIREVQSKKRSAKVDTRLLISNRIVDEYFRDSIDRTRRKVVKNMEDNDSKILMVTSSVEQEGKTMVATNLALSLSAAGSKVVLLQANFRNTSYLLNAKGPGITEYMEGKVELQDIVKEISENLYLIMPGKNGRIGLLTSKKLKHLLEQLKAFADYVIIDSAPMTTVADASVLLERVDEVLYVVRQDYVFKKNVEEGLELLERSGKPAFGYIMNYSESSLTENAKYGYGKYGYGKYGKYANLSGHEVEIKDNLVDNIVEREE